MPNIKNTNLILTAMLLYAVSLPIRWLLWFLEISPYLENIPILFIFTLAFGTLLIVSPRASWASLVRLRERLGQHHWLAFALFALLILAIDSIYFVIVKCGADERALLSVVQTLNKQGVAHFFANYAQMPWLGTQHPPLAALGAGGAVHLFGGNVLITTRAVTGLLGLAIAGCTYLIARQLYDRQTALMAAFLLFALRNFYLFNIRAANDLYVTFFFTLTVLLLMYVNTTTRNLSSQSLWWAVAAGISLGLGLLSKYTMVLAYLLLPAMIWWPFAHQACPNSPQSDALSLSKGWGEEGRGRIDTTKSVPFGGKSFWFGIRQLTIVIAVSFLFLAGWLWHLNELGLFQQQVATILYYIGFEVESSSEGIKVIEYKGFNALRIRFLIRALTYKIPSYIGLYNLPLIALGLWVYFIQRRLVLTQEGKANVMWSNRFVLLWLAVIFIPVLLTLPVARYLFPAYPALAIMMAHGLRTMCKEPTRVVIFVVVLSLSSLVFYVEPIPEHRCIAELSIYNTGVTHLTP